MKQLAAAHPAHSIAAHGQRARNRQEVIKRILDSARHEFVAHGVNAADIADIAQRAQIGRATFYRYFDCKDALIAALMDEDWDKQALIFQRLVDNAVLTSPVIESWLHALVRATRARLNSFAIFYSVQSGTPLARLELQRCRLMDILGTRFAGFSASCDVLAERMEAVLLLFQIEQFAVHAAASKMPAEIQCGVELLAGALAGRVTPPPGAATGEALRQ